MIDIVWQVWEIAVTLFECFVSTHFLCSFLGQETHSKQGKLRWCGLVLCYATAVTTLNQLMPYEGTLDLIYITIFFVYSCAFLPGTVLQKGLVSVLTLCIVVMNSSFGANLVGAVMRTDLSTIYGTQGMPRFLAMLLVQIMNLFVFRLLSSVIGKSKADFHLSEWLMLGSIFLLSIAAMVCIQLSLLHSDVGQTEHLLLLGVDIIIIAVNYIAIRLLLYINQMHEKELEHKLLREQMLYQTQYAKNMKQQEESIRKLRHDFKATVSVLQNFISGQNTGEAEKYLNAYQQAVEQNASIIHTNQPFLNAILNTKLTYAKEQGVRCSCHFPEILPDLDDIDYCILLGNLLDNAIEAEQCAEITEPEIQVNLSQYENKICIVIRNRIAESVLESNPDLISAKSDSIHHGFGIRTVREIVEKHHGTIIFYEESRWFVVNAELDITQKR